MLFYMKLGLRNLLKNYRRSIKTIMTVVIGLGACLLAQGFMAHTLGGLKEALINGGLGHIQLYQQGFLEYGNEAPYQYLIANPPAVIRELKSVPEIKLFAPRLSFQGLASAGEKSAIFIGTAGVPKKEWRLNSFATLKAGSFLKDEKPYGLMIGSGLARKLDVGVGDNITLMTAMRGGGVNALDMEVIGIIEMQIKNYNDVVLLANLATVQRLINLPGSVDRIILLLTKTERLEQVKADLSKLVTKNDLEGRDWRQLAGRQYTQPKLFYDLVYLLTMTIIVLVVVFSITNTLNLTIQERVREIGTIRSLGTTRLQVAQIFITESFLIGLIGVLLGLMAGYGVAALLNAGGGIPMPPPPGQARGYTALFKPDFSQALWLGLLFLITATVAGFYPALRAARLQIINALRWL